MLLTGAPAQTLKSTEHAFLIVELLDRFCEREKLFDVFDLLLCLRRKQSRDKNTYNPATAVITLLIDGYRVQTNYTQLREAVEFNYRRRDEQRFLDRLLR